ncbi:MAG: hypothetical protein DIU71_18550, partial [Proteobacteria bacterium]
MRPVARSDGRAADARAIPGYLGADARESRGMPEQRVGCAPLRVHPSSRMLAGGAGIGPPMNPAEEVPM